MAFDRGRKMHGAYACGFAIMTMSGMHSLAAETPSDADGFGKPSVAARSDASTAATGRAPLAARIMAGSRAPNAPEPVQDATDSAMAKPDSAMAKSASEPSRTSSPADSSNRGVEDAAGSASTETSKAVSASEPVAKRSPPSRMAAINPSGASASWGADKSQPAAQGPKTTTNGSRVSSSPQTVVSREQTQASRRPNPNESQGGAFAPPVAKPSKSKWSFQRWFDMEWIRPAEPLPMIPTPWSYGKGEANRSPSNDKTDTMEDQQVSKTPRTQVSMPRVSVDVRESVLEASEGELVTFRIFVMNTGNRAAHDIDTTMFFAEGIEAEAADGAESTISAGEVRFETIEKIEPGQKIELSVKGRTGPPGIVVYRTEVIGRETPGTVAREGAVTVLGRVFGPEENGPGASPDAADDVAERREETGRTIADGS